MKRRIEFIFQREDLIKDVERITHLESEAITEPQAVKVKYNIAVGADGNTQREKNEHSVINHYLTLAVGEVNALFTEFFVATDNNTAIKITFYTPANFATGATTTIREALNHYFICRILSLWYDITNKNAAQIYYNEAQSALKTINTALYRRNYLNRMEVKTFDNNNIIN